MRFIVECNGVCRCSYTRDPLTPKDEVKDRDRAEGSPSQSQTKTESKKTDPQSKPEPRTKTGSKKTDPQAEAEPTRPHANTEPEAETQPGANSAAHSQATDPETQRTLQTWTGPITPTSFSPKSCLLSVSFFVTPRNVYELKQSVGGRTNKATGRTSPNSQRWLGNKPTRNKREEEGGLLDDTRQRKVKTERNNNGVDFASVAEALGPSTQRIEPGRDGRPDTQTHEMVRL